MRQRTPIRFFSLVIFTLTFTALAYAQGPQRTFVSAQNGNDANTVSNCSVTQPCRSFNAAIGVVRAGGEVVALDSGGYGQVTINKSVTLTAPTGVYVAVTAQAAGSNAIEVNAAGGFQGGDTVVLRGLTLTGLGGSNGILVTSVGTLHVEGCVISGFADRGIYVNITSLEQSTILIKDSIVRNNGSDGILLQAIQTQGVLATIDNCRSERNGNNGFVASNNSRVTINRSVASLNNRDGFFATSNISGASAVLSCAECVSSNNVVHGFEVLPGPGASAKIRVSHSVAAHNFSRGFFQSGVGNFESLGNNMVAGNGDDSTTGITVIALK